MIRESGDHIVVMAYSSIVFLIYLQHVRMVESRQHKCVYHLTLRFKEWINFLNRWDIIVDDIVPNDLVSIIEHRDSPDDWFSLSPPSSL